VSDQITFATCQAWARAIIAVRGRPPYIVGGDITGTLEEMNAYEDVCTALLSDFCEHWKDKL